jgi:hypothetical protein
MFKLAPKEVKNMPIKKEDLWTMPISELESIVTGCSPTSDDWNKAWPVYKVRRLREEARARWISFGVSTVIALVAFIRTFISH